MHKGRKIGLITLGAMVFLIIVVRTAFYLKEGNVMDFPGFVVCKGQGYSCGRKDGELMDCRCSDPKNEIMIDSPFLLRVAKAFDYRAY